MFVDKGKYFQIKELEKYGIKAIYTTVDMGNFQEEETRKEAIKTLNLEKLKIYTGHQTHSKNVMVIDNKTSRYIEDIDGFVTDKKDAVIFTRYADCLPIYLYDKKKGIFGCVHSGWMGSYQEICREAIKKMCENFNSLLEDIIVAFGIGIAKYNYEVGIEFYNKFSQKFEARLLENVFELKNKKIYFDNQEFNYNLLKKIGILDKNIIRNDLCTFSNDRFHSYRRDKKDSGRNAAYIFIDKTLTK
nr:peptidoglycan editing factor PgeF [uncultured Cetobacterium sp.]